jgi:hypothetical protein
MKNTLSIPRALGHLFAITLTLCLVGCSASSALVDALDAITIAADLAPTAFPNLSPQASACIAAIPDAVTTVADIIAGGQPIATAQTAIADLQVILATQCVASVIPAKDQALIGNIASAVSKFLTLYQQQVASKPVTAALVAHGYAMGFVDSSNVAKAKYKGSAADKKKAAEIKARAAKIKAAVAAAKK